MRKNNYLSQFESLLFKPVDSSSLALFRFLFGAILGYFAYYHLITDTIYSKYLQTQFYFSFSLFDFLRLKPLWAGDLYTLFKIIGISACCIGLGIFYRFSLILFFCSFGYMFLLDKTYFNNHYYLILLITFLFFFVGANKWASIDALREPSAFKEKIPFWHIFILRAQICIVYFFAGITKINKDYLSGMQTHIWLVEENLLPFLQPWASTQHALLVFIYGSIFIDLSIAFFLCYRPTRVFAFIVAIVFHVTNMLLFQIGIFHYFMIATLILFVEPEQPRNLWRKIISFFRPQKNISVSENIKEVGSSPAKRKLALAFVTIYLLIQCLLPLRHFFYKGDVNWTREGHRFAWRLKANITSGGTSILVTDSETDKKAAVIPFEDLSAEQIYIMNYTPDMILQYVHFLKEKYRKRGFKNPVINVDGKLSLNGRPFLPYIDPNINLAEKKDNLFKAADWILPPPPDF